jgi:voltage-gated potassium channel
VSTRSAIETAIARRRHLVLLAALVVMLTTQPLLGHVNPVAGAGFDLLFAAIGVFLFYGVFTEAWQRKAGLVLLVPALLSNLAFLLLPGRSRVHAEVAYHAFVVLFLALAVAAILRDIFRRKVIGGDEVVGALCGSLLGGLAWANLYAAVYVLAPGAFSVSHDVAWRLERWHLRRALFDYLSFATMTGLGYADITPIGPPAYSLTWLEVVFAQFYLAAVVAQLVGLKLARTGGGDGPGSTPG